MLVHSALRSHELYQEFTAFIRSNRTDVQPKPKTHEVMPSDHQGPPVKRLQSTWDLRPGLLAAGSNHLDSCLLRQGRSWGGGNSTSTVAPERACLRGERSRFKGMIARHHISFLLVQYCRVRPFISACISFLFHLQSWLQSVPFHLQKEGLRSLRGCIMLSHGGCTHMQIIKPDLLTHVGYIFSLTPTNT